MSTPPTRSPLSAVLAFSALNNLATGVATVGVFFLTESAYGFTTADNYVLGLLLGATYAVAAVLAGGVVRRIARPGGRSSRAALAWMVVAMAALCAAPLVLERAGLGGRLTMFAFVALYTPITGVFWPLVESFLSGGRRAEELRRAIGAFNVTWSGSMAVGMWLVAPLVERAPLVALAALGPVHLLSLAVLRPLGRDPGRHWEDSDPVPENYRALLRGHRILLVAGYVVMFALTPFLPEALRRVEAPERWSAALGSAWMAARVGVFWALGRWHGWHGRRAAAVVATVLLVAGFALAVAPPEWWPPSARIPALVGGQVVFGIALATLYTANLYYSLEVGSAAVDAGGSHEALIGLGYTLGPLLGWCAHGLARAGALPAERTDEAVALAVLSATAVAAVWAWRAARP